MPLKLIMKELFSIRLIMPEMRIIVSAPNFLRSKFLCHPITPTWELEESLMQTRMIRRKWESPIDHYNEWLNLKGKRDVIPQALRNTGVSGEAIPPRRKWKDSGRGQLSLEKGKWSKRRLISNREACPLEEDYPPWTTTLGLSAPRATEQIPSKVTKITPNRRATMTL